MKILHLCSDYARQALYGQLLLALSSRGVAQTMYVPVRTAGEVDAGRVVGEAPIAYRFKHILKPYHRVLFRTKIRTVTRDVVGHLPVADHDLVHAHFLYSDGAVARRLHRQFGLPYLVAVRNTDVNSFMRYRPDLAGVGRDVLLHAASVVFLSPAYRDAFLLRLSTGMREEVAGKAVVVPNGLSRAWLQGGMSNSRRTELSSPLKLLYVGDFTPNKNLRGVVAALQRIQQRQPATLTVVGGGGDRRGEVQALLDAHKDDGVHQLGRITDPAILRDIYGSHDVLVMPSYHETFGIAYIEALSQGTPVVHSRGQGVDGYFDDATVAEAVDPRDPASVARGVHRLAERLPTVRSACREAVARFDWGRIAADYYGLYQTLLRPSALPYSQDQCATSSR
jgi:glycosyltransferase involved in cell wall biosynthesis